MAEMEECRTSDARLGRRRGWVSALALLALFVVWAAMPAAASAQKWSQPIDLSEAGQITQDPWLFIEGVEKPPDVGLDDNGNATFAWRRMDTTQSCGYSGCWQVQAVRRSASGVMGEVRTLSPPGISAVNPQVQVAANGNVVVAWEQGGLVVARTRRASGLWGPVRNISGPTPLAAHFADSSFSMDLNAQGDAEFAWVVKTGGRNAGRVFVRSWSHTGALGPRTSVGTGEQRSPQVAVFSNGDAIAAWTAPDGETCGIHPCVQLYERSISAASSLGPTEAVSPSDQRVVRGTQRLAVNAAGAALFAWQQEDQSGCSFRHTLCSRVLVRGRSATGEFTPRQIASEGSGLVPDSLQLGLDGDGGAVVAWLEYQYGGLPCNAALRCLQLGERSAAGDLSPVQTITTDARSLELQLAPDGDGLLTWLAGDGNLDGCPYWDWGCMRMRTMDRAPDGSLGPIETVSPGGQDAIS